MQKIADSNLELKLKSIICLSKLQACVSHPDIAFLLKLQLELFQNDFGMALDANQKFPFMKGFNLLRSQLDSRCNSAQSYAEYFPDAEQKQEMANTICEENRDFLTQLNKLQATYGIDEQDNYSSNNVGILGKTTFQ